MSQCPLRILFVCGGNTCRSPMAEAVLAHRAAVTGLPLEVASAGINVDQVGEPISSEADLVLSQHGYHIRAHKARQTHIDDFLRFDLIVAMTRAHQEQLLAMAPQKRQTEIRLLSEFVPGLGPTDVADPLGRGLAAYEDALCSIEAGITGLLRWAGANPALPRAEQL